MDPFVIVYEYKMMLFPGHILFHRQHDQPESIQAERTEQHDPLFSHYLESDQALCEFTFK